MHLHPDYTTKDSPWSVAETVQQVATLITERGICKANEKSILVLFPEAGAFS